MNLSARYSKKPRTRLRSGVNHVSSNGDGCPDKTGVPAGPLRVEIRSPMDIVTARQEGRQLASKMGLSGSDVTLVAAAISEVARNIVQYAQEGEILLDPIRQNGRQGIMIVARDAGPGIPDVDLAMQYGYSTRRGLGVGLPSATWLMDEFDIVSKVGAGTTVTMKKFVNS